MTDLPDEATVRDLYFYHIGDYPFPKTAQRVAAIVAKLPKPVDPDLIEARKLAEEYSVIGRRYSEGQSDDTSRVRLVLAALKRGRELAKEGR